MFLNLFRIKGKFALSKCWQFSIDGFFVTYCTLLTEEKQNIVICSEHLPICKIIDTLKNKSMTIRMSCSSIHFYTSIDEMDLLNALNIWTTQKVPYFVLLGCIYNNK